MRAALAFLALASLSSRSLAFDSAIRGATADVSVGTSGAGDTLMLELGGESAGLRTYSDRRWLFQWNVLFAGRAGYLANQHPFLFLLGIHTAAWAEMGYRFMPASKWSPYLGVRLGGDAFVMPHPGSSLSDLRSINSVDGVGGLGARGIVRLEAGASLFSGAHALLLVGFLQEQLDAPEIATPGFTFTEGGVGLRYDMMRRVVLLVEGVIGWSATRTITPLGYTDQTLHAGISTGVRRLFENGMWFGASAFVERNTDHIQYANGTSFGTGDPSRIGLMVSFGLPLWKVKR